MVKNFYVEAVEPIESVVGCNPHKTIFVLSNGVDMAVGQAFLSRIFSEVEMVGDGGLRHHLRLREVGGGGQNGAY